MENDMTQDRKVRLEKLEKIKAMGINPYPNRYKPDTLSVDAVKLAEKEDDKTIKIAGRIMILRKFGKAAFALIKDSASTIQVYFKKDILSEDDFVLFKLLDMSDVIGCEGKMFITHKGEPTLEVHKLTLLSKALNTLPEKFHGLSDVELRYRQRYVDMIVNDEVRRNMETRFKVISFIRRHLEEKGFLEVETPMMQPIPGGANAKPFITHHNALDRDLYLRIAPELYLKRTVVGGLERIFEINRCFRNEGIDTSHNPEFTTIELYEAYSDMQGMMDIFEDVVKEAAIYIKGSSKFTYQGVEVDFGNWQKMSYVDALKDLGKIDVSNIKTREDAKKLAIDNGVKEIEPHQGKWSIINELYEMFVEPKLIQPTIIHHYPTEISPLSKKDPENEEFTERFEAFCMNMELCNAFSELNDPQVQYDRFKAQAEKKATGDDEAMFMDLDYVNALSYAMPPAGGLGIGIDRLVMFLIDTISIRDVILFPTMKPRNK